MIFWCVVMHDTSTRTAHAGFVWPYSWKLIPLNRILGRYFISIFWQTLLRFFVLWNDLFSGAR